VVGEHRLDLFAGAAERVLRVEAGRVGEGAAAAGDPDGEPARRSAGELAWRLEGVTAGPGKAIIEGLSAEGRAGQVVAVTGANGSGKTTLLRVLAGLLEPGSGRVERRPGRVAYLPQDPAALLHQPTVIDEVRLTLRRTHGHEDPDRLLAEMGLEGLADRYPRDLSGGERQRAAIACVIAGPPALALLDEPTRGMDAGARRRLAAAVDRLARGGAAVVLATHDRALAAALADSVLRLG
jgi:energy-coupling factor transport system ATP-binding protein